MRLPGWAREPLVHFLAAGAILFAVFAVTGDGPADPASRLIEVDREDQARLALQFERNFGRAPSDAELDAQIERHVRDEVLYREALRLGLDQGDPAVRQRLVSKMDMAAGAAGEAAAPSERELEDWLAAHPDRFRPAARYSFDQVFFLQRTDAAQFVAGLDGFRSGWKVRGDPISLPPTLEAMPASEIAARFGQQFALEIADVESTGGWAGPIRSGFGWHAVRLREIESPALPKLRSIREQVEHDWRRAQVASRKERAYAILRDAYRVEIDR